MELMRWRLQNPEYRQLLIQTIHTCAIKHSEVASNVVHVLMEFLGDANNASAVDVIAFVREVVEKFPALRSGIVEKLLSTFNEIKSGKVFRGALWIVGEYGNTVEDIKETMQQIRTVLGEVPILASEQVRSSLSLALRWVLIGIARTAPSGRSRGRDSRRRGRGIQTHFHDQYPRPRRRNLRHRDRLLRHLGCQPRSCQGCRQAPFAGPHSRRRLLHWFGPRELPYEARSPVRRLVAGLARGQRDASRGAFHHSFSFKAQCLIPSLFFRRRCSS